MNNADPEVLAWSKVSLQGVKVARVIAPGACLLGGRLLLWVHRGCGRGVAHHVVMHAPGNAAGIVLGVNCQQQGFRYPRRAYQLNVRCAPAICVVCRLVVTTAAVQVTPSVLRADGSVDSPSPLARELCALRLLPPHRNVTMLLAMGSERLSPALASHVGEALVEAGS